MGLMKKTKKYPLLLQSIAKKQNIEIDKELAPHLEIQSLMPTSKTNPIPARPVTAFIPGIEHPDYFSSPLSSWAHSRVMIPVSPMKLRSSLSKAEFLNPKAENQKLG